MTNKKLVKTGFVVVAHGKMLNSEKALTIISAYEASMGHKLFLEHLKDTFAKRGAKTTFVGFSDPMDLNLAIRLAEGKVRAAEKCLAPESA